MRGVERLPRHLKRKTGSEGSRAMYLKTLAQLVALPKEEVEKLVQEFCDQARNTVRYALR
ncbi:MAG: hypothetical protein QXI39_03315 [Candidatus Bathyarchaeia archaeon]